MRLRSIVWSFLRSMPHLIVELETHGAWSRAWFRVWTCLSTPDHACRLLTYPLPTLGAEGIGQTPLILPNVPSASQQNPVPAAEAPTAAAAAGHNLCRLDVLPAYPGMGKASLLIPLTCLPRYRQVDAAQPDWRDAGACGGPDHAQPPHPVCDLQPAPCGRPGPGPEPPAVHVPLLCPHPRAGAQVSCPA